MRSGRSRGILVACDDPAVSDLWSETLAASGYEVRVAHDGPSALVHDRDRAADLVVFALAEADDGGFELLTERPGRPALVVGGREEHTPKPWVGLPRVELIEGAPDPTELRRRVDVLLAATSAPGSGGREGESGPTLPRSWPEVGVFDPAGRREGTLDALGFAPVFGTLHRAGASGVLLLERSAIKKMVHLNRGRPVAARSNLLSECLGRLLTAEGRVSDIDCAEALKHKQVSGARIGEALVRMGRLTGGELDVALSRQMRDRLIECFSWTQGKYLFVPRPHQGSELDIGVAPAELVYEGLSAHVDDRSVAHALEPLGDRIILPVNDPVVRGLAETLDASAWRSIDAGQEHTVTETLALSSDGAERRARLLYALGLTGGLVLGTPRPGPVRTAKSPTALLGRGFALPAGTRAARTQTLTFGGMPTASEGLRSPPRPPRGLAFGPRPKAASIDPASGTSGEVKVPISDLGGGLALPAAAESSDEALLDTRFSLPTDASPLPPDETSSFRSKAFARPEVDAEMEGSAYAQLSEARAELRSASVPARLGLVERAFLPDEVASAHRRAVDHLRSTWGSYAALSGRCAEVYESMRVALDDARADLEHPDVGYRYRETPPPAPRWLDALERFEAGLVEARRGDRNVARGLFLEAAELDPETQDYAEHARACEPPHDVDVPVGRWLRARSLDAATEAGQAAWRAVLEADADDPEALRALRPTEAPQGFWSRLRKS